MTLSCYDILQQSRQLPGWVLILVLSALCRLSNVLSYQTLLIGQVSTTDIDPLFSWQYDESAPCPVSQVAILCESTKPCLPERMPPRILQAGLHHLYKRNERNYEARISWPFHGRYT